MTATRVPMPVGELSAGAPAAEGVAAGARYRRRFRAAADPAYGLGMAARVGAGLMVFPPDVSFGPRKQTGYEIVLLHRGGLVIEIDGVELTLRPNEVALLRPGAWCVFRFTTHTETRVSYVATYDPALPLALLELLDVAPFTLPASETMERLVRTVLALPEMGGAGRDRKAAAVMPMAAPMLLATAGIALYVDEARASGLVSAERTVRHEHPAVAAAREIVRQRLGEHIGLKEMAEAAHVAPEHLVRLFRGRLGTTPVRYLWAARVRLGVHLLEHSDLSIAEVSTRVGCLSPKHFARLVRAEVGVPPRDVRQRGWSYVAAPAS